MNKTLITLFMVDAVINYALGTLSFIPSFPRNFQLSESCPFYVTEMDNLKNIRRNDIRAFKNFLGYRI